MSQVVVPGVWQDHVASAMPAQLAPTTLVDVCRRDGRVFRNEARRISWLHGLNAQEDDIVAWRVIPDSEVPPARKPGAGSHQPLIDAIQASVDRDEARKHAHYYKDVKHLDTIDVYRVLVLFDVIDPCLQHAVKKLLVAGGRGAGKDVSKDVQEAIDSLTRWQGMRAEDAKGGM